MTISQFSPAEIGAVAAVAALATVLLLPESPNRRMRRLKPVSDSLPRRLVNLSWATVITGAVVVLTMSGHPGFVICAAVIIGMIIWFVTVRRRRRAAAKLSDEIAQAATGLALLLKSGMIPGDALVEVAHDAPVLASAAAAAKLGGDPAEAMLTHAEHTNQTGLRLIASAWTISQASGAPVAAVLERVAEQLREQRRIQAVVDSELSSARTSGNMMALLPVVGIGLAFAVNADPWRFFTGSILGELVFAGAVLLSAAGILLTDKIATRAAQ